jgi:hypothetical protein
VGLSTEYGREKVSSGSSRVEVRCSPEEYLVAKGEAVNGKGFLRTGDEEVDEEEERARSRIIREGIRGRVPVSWACCGGLLVEGSRTDVGVDVDVGVGVGAVRSDGFEASGVSGWGWGRGAEGLKFSRRG